jgi:acyl-CoA hydrolase
MGGKQHSGIGGHEDFVAGAALQLEDRSLLCLRSSTMQADGRVSRIMPFIDNGLLVTTPRHQTDVVITEYGVAELRGKTVRERADALVDIAHPDFRDELRAAAATLDQ